MRKLACALAALALIPFALLAGAGPAAASTTYNELRTQQFTATPRPGAQTCQHRYVTLPKLASGHYYAWAEVFDGQDEGHWTRYDTTYHGKFYWTTCVQGIKNTYYNYEIWSLLTLVNSACENSGKCTTYRLPGHLFRLEQSAKYYWGSQVWSTLVV